jgi:hypothetical protein
LNTSSNGNPDPDQALTPAPKRRRGIWFTLLGFLLVIIAFLISIQVIAVLYAIINPPLPPVYTSAQQLEYRSQAYGVDEWVYGTTEDACRVSRFFANNGGNCAFTRDVCDRGFIDPAEVLRSENVAQCTGIVQFSIFAMRWRVSVAGGYRDRFATRFVLTREVFWSGEVPPSMRDIFDEIDRTSP